MEKIHPIIQAEASIITTIGMMIASGLLIGTILIIAPMTLWNRVLLGLGGVLGLIFLSLQLVAAYQQYVAIWTATKMQQDILSSLNKNLNMKGGIEKDGK